MMTMLMGIGVAMTPLLMIVGMLGLAEWRERKRSARYARQIELTEAIHRELGAAAAPVVEEGPGGRWLVKLTVPLDQPALMTAMLRITERVFGPRATRPGNPFRIVLTPAAPAAVVSFPRSVRPRPVASRSAMPAVR